MSFEWTEPVVLQSINRLSYQWDALDLLVEADRITDAGQAELWFYHSNGIGNKLLHIAKVNLLSSSTMTQLAKRMGSHSLDIPWEQALTFITKTTMEYQRRGEPARILQPVSAEVLKPVYYIEPVIIKGVPNIIYGDKGVNKTTLALTMLGLIEMGYAESPSEFIPNHTAKTAMLDWEGTEDLTNYTLARLVEGDTIPYFELNYLRCKAPLSDDIDRIASFIHDCHAEVVVIDSLGQAAGSDKFDSAGKGAALKFFECLRQLNITSLIIAQNAKGEGDGKKTIFGCYSEDTEVLTNSGWKRHTDIQENDQIICYDPDAKCLRQEHFTQRWEYDYDGELIHINHKATEALITPNHTVLTTNQGVITAENLAHYINPAYKLPYNTPLKLRGKHSKHSGRHQKRFWLAPNTKWLDMSAFLRFIAYFISEGSINKGQASLTQTEGDVLEKMKGCLNQLGFPFTEQKAKRKEGWKPCSQLNIAADAGQRNSQFTHSIRKCSRRPKYNQYHLLVNWLRDNCGEGAANKHLPLFVWDLPRKQQQILMDALIEGDGHLYDDGHRVYTTISKQLADDIQRLVMLIGFGSQIATRQRGDYQPQYELLISKASRSTITINPSRNIQRQTYQGKVYCLTVPTGYYVTRYNGRVAILGNSTYYTYYSRNIFELKGKDDEMNSDRSHLALFHTEANYSKKYPAIGFCVDYTETTIKLTREAVSVSQFLEKASQMKSLLEFLTSGAKTRQAVADQLSISPKHAGVLLNRALKKDTVTNLGSGLWGLTYQDDSMDNKVG